MKKILFPLIFSAVLAKQIFAAEEKPIISSSSVIDWSKSTFVSDVKLDTERAGINMPSGKRAAINFVEIKLPDLIKDPAFTLCKLKSAAGRPCSCKRHEP